MKWTPHTRARIWRYPPFWCPCVLMSTENNFLHNNFPNHEEEKIQMILKSLQEWSECSVHTWLFTPKHPKKLYHFNIFFDDKQPCIFLGYHNIPVSNFLLILTCHNFYNTFEVFHPFVLSFFYVEALFLLQIGMNGYRMTRSTFSVRSIGSNIRYPFV